MSFAEKVILITGASSGIGADAAIHFAKLGASVAIVGRNATRLSEVAETIRSSGSTEPLAIVADVTKDTEQIISKTIGKFGKLDVLINNAGIIRNNSGETLGTLDTFDEVFDVNVRSVLALTKLAVPYLEKTKGNVINISSISGNLTTSRHTAYAVAKAALDHLTLCAAVELSKKGIRVNAVKPGVIKTRIFESCGISATEADAMFEAARLTYPVGRYGLVEDTTQAIAFLANDASSFITGHILYVDGGKHLVK